MLRFDTFIDMAQVLLQRWNCGCCSTAALAMIVAFNTAGPMQLRARLLQFTAVTQ